MQPLLMGSSSRPCTPDPAAAEPLPTAADRLMTQTMSGVYAVAAEPIGEYRECPSGEGWVPKVSRLRGVFRGTEERDGVICSTEEFPLAPDGSPWFPRSRTREGVPETERRGGGRGLRFRTLAGAAAALWGRFAGGGGDGLGWSRALAWPGAWRAERRWEGCGT